MIKIEKNILEEQKRELNQSVENNINNQELEKKQNQFLQTTLGKTINTAVDIGIRALLPEFIDEQIINIKDNLLNYGLKEGINKTINDAVDLGKSAIGIVTGNFENISQMQNAIQTGGLIDGISSLLDVVVDKAREANLINNTVASTIKKGKNIILNNVESNIEATFRQQYKAIEYADKYISNWKECFSNEDFEGMEKEYKKLNKQLKDLAPIEKTINEAKSVEMLHKLIKNNGQNFDLTNEQLELVEKLK